MKPGTYGRHILTESSGMDDLVVANGVPAMHAGVSPGKPALQEASPGTTRETRSKELQAKRVGEPSSNQGNSKQKG